MSHEDAQDFDTSDVNSTPPADGGGDAGGDSASGGILDGGEGLAPPPADNDGAQDSAAPESYELKLPDASPLDDAQLKGVSEFARENGLTQEQAQALLERESGQVGQFGAEQEQLVAETKDRWYQEVISDPQIGGDNLSETKRLCGLAFQKVPGGEQLKASIEGTAYANNPELVRFLRNVAHKFLDSDKFVAGSAGRIRPNKKAAADVLFPTHSEGS